MTSRILHAARSAARRVSGSFWNGGLLSLITPTVIVLAVLAFAVASYSLGPSDPSVASVYGSANPK